MDTTAATIELRPTADSSQFTRTHVEADTTESPNLSLRPLKKHTNVRIGEKLELTGFPSKSSLFAISNKHGWFFAGNEHAIMASPLSELRSALGQTNTQEEVTFTSQVSINVGSATPLFICLAAGEEKLVVASSNVITTRDVSAVINGTTPPTGSLTLDGLVIVDVQPNPGDNPELVAVLTTGNAQGVVVLFNCINNTELVRWSGLKSDGTAPVAISWSTRGKQIAIATSSGDILQYSPADPAAAKATIPRAQGPNLTGTVPIMLQWLSNYTFYVVYAEPKPDESLDEYQPDQHNYVLTYDKKSNHITDTNIPLPWDAYGLSREPGHQTKLLRGWGRFKHLIFVNDAHASDVGVVACIGDASTTDESGTWSKLSFEDGSMTFPLTADMDDTSLIGMDFDFSADTSLLGANQANGDDPTIPPAPILYLLTNDLVVVGFHVVSEDGMQYPGMAQATADQGMEMATEKAPTPAPVQAAAPTQAPAATPSPFAASVPSFGQSGFGFGAAAAPKFGSSGFGSTPAASPFATASQGSSGTSLGFGAFASAKPAFGQSTFGATTPASSSTGASSASQGTPTSSFGGGFGAFAGSKPAFGQSTFGAPSTQTQSAFGNSTPASSPFAQAAAAPSPATPVSPPAESSTGPAAQGPATTASQPASAETAFKPASGFGAFSKLNTGGSGGFGAFSNPKPIDPQAKPLTFAGFGGASTTPAASSNTTPAFGATTTPTFGATTTPGQPKFGQSTLGTSAFGQSAFGQTGFGQAASGPAKSPFAIAAAAAATSSTKPSGGGFGAFASAPTGFAALAKTATESKPAAHLGLPPDSTETPKPTATAKAPSVPKSFFGTNAAVSHPGFAAKGLRDTGSKEDDEEDTEKSKERFPEDEADKLEPETVYEGPGLFGPPSGKGKATQGLGGLGLKDQSGSGNAPAAKPLQAFGQKLDPSKAAASAAAAFGKPAAAGTSTFANAGQGSLQTKTGATPVSAFAPPAKTTPPTPPEKQPKSDDEESEGSVEVDDDINEFLEGESFEGVDAAEDEEDEEEEEEEDDVEEEYDEDEDGEDDEEVLSDLPDDDDDGSADEESPQKAKQSTKDAKPVASMAKQPPAPAPFNPFGRPGATAPGISGQPSAASSSNKSSIPNLLSRIDKAPTPPGTSASPGPSTPTPRTQPVGTPITSVQAKEKPRPASPKAPFGSWAAPPASKQTTDLSKPVRPQTPPGLFGKPPTASVAGSSGAPVPVTPTPATASRPQQPANPVPEVKAIQPVHPELQAQLDRVLNEYSAILYHINERSKKAKASFDAFKGTGPAVGDEFQASYEWNGQNIPTLKRTLNVMEETVKTVCERTSKLQRQLDELSSSTLRLEMKKEETSRYLRARQNPEFVEKFITPRGLGPEHTENQIKLRKGLKVQKTRVLELEEQIQALKKKVDKFKGGELSIEQLDLDKVRKIHQNTEWFASGLTSRLDGLTSKVDALPNQATSKKPRRLSEVGTHDTISRTSSFGPDIIATTAETFSAEAKMTKLSELLVEARTAAPINPSVPPEPPKPASPPSKSSAVDSSRRTPAINRPHSRAPQISRNGPVHTSDFSFGPPPPPASNAVKLPSNFVSFTSSKGQQ
ncbi:hypothetical protein M408DRAFT_326194 [Serendipita vermifera MAFF 305830]|uniref:Nucleoporin Nup159/Nup146 N-terminal domain-containing protein n=1 Tax=Serendipita vermifera MAFF 305830 TaxID=933852 RepID=A0A0C3B9J0_SERVB|nr:hypothetical protein M408DRAFT_326194 [Serendipita vermifera MAFF 305830]